MAYIYDLVDTWASGGGPYTSIKMNATDNDVGSASLLMDLQVGGASKFKVSKDGVLNLGNGSTIITPNYAGATTFQYLNNGLKFLNTTGVYYAGFADSAIGISQNGATAAAGVLTLDVVLRAAGAGSLALGAFNTTGTTAPTPQSLSVQSWASSTTSNQTGANFTINGSQGTGTGAGGSIIFRVAPAGGTSNGVQNALATALTIAGDRKITFADAGAQAYIDKDGKASFYSGRFTAGSGFASPWVTIADNTLGINFNDAAYLSWCNNSNASSGTADVRLYRDAANTLALRNGTAAQTFHIYNTYTGVSDYARWRFVANSGPDLLIENDAAGSGGTSGSLILGTNAGGSVYLKTNTSNRWQVNSSGHFLAVADNLYDIGASGATRPRSVYTGSSVYFGGDVFCANGIFFGGASYTKGYIYSNSDGVWSLNNSTSTSFGRLQFGGTTSSFPALKRSSTTLQARLADDSAFASVQGKLTTETAYTAGAPTATGYLVVYDSNGTAYKIPAVAV